MSLRDPIAAVVIFALAAAFFFIGGTYRGGAEIFPRAVAAIMMFGSALLFFKGLLWGSTGHEKLEEGSLWRVTGVIVLTILYIVAVDTIGFFTSSLIFVPVMALFLGVRNYLMIGLTTIVFVVAVAYLFRAVFLVPLPRDLFFTFF